MNRHRNNKPFLSCYHYCFSIPVLCSVNKRGGEWGNKLTLQRGNYRTDGFNRVGGMSGNEGWDRKVNILKADSQISGHKRIEGWWEEGWQEGGRESQSSCSLYYLSSVTRKCPVRAASWFIHSQTGNFASLGTENPVVPPTTPSAYWNSTQLQPRVPRLGNSHNPKCQYFFCGSFTLICKRIKKVCTNQISICCHLVEMNKIVWNNILKWIKIAETDSVTIAMTGQSTTRVGGWHCQITALQRGILVSNS